MVKINLGFDKLNSLLVSYHILCAPTEMNMKYNPNIFANLSVSEEQAERYLAFLPYKKKNTDPDSIVPDLIFPRAETLGYLFFRCENQVSAKVKKDLRGFEKSSASYFQAVSGSLKPLIHERTREAANHIDNIYDTAQELSGIAITRPKELDIYVVEGFAPQAMGSEVIDGLGFVVVSPHTFSKERRFMDLLVHETVAHQTVDESRKLLRGVFGKYVYDAEEGFAKMFSGKITEKMLGFQASPGLYGPLEQLSHDVFGKNWRALRSDDFSSWYLDCLKEIKQKTG